MPQLAPSCETGQNQILIFMGEPCLEPKVDYNFRCVHFLNSRVKSLVCTTHLVFRNYGGKFVDWI